MPVQVKHNNDGKFYHIAIDIAKEGAQLFDLTPYVKGRVGDNGFGLIIDWYRQGLLMNVNGTYKPVIDGLVGGYSFDKNNNLKMADDASPVYSVGKPEDCGPAGQVTYYFPEQMFPKEGIFKGYLGLIDDKGNRYSGVDIWFAVLAGNARMGIACDFYISELEKAIATAEEDLRNSKKSMQTVVDEFTSKMNDLTNRLETQATTDQATLDALEAKIKQDGLFTQAEADDFKKVIEKELTDLTNKESKFEESIKNRVIDIADYGGTGAGLVDESSAIQSAIDQARNNFFSGHGQTVVQLHGTYLINKTLVLPTYVHLKASGYTKLVSTISNGPLVHIKYYDDDLTGDKYTYLHDMYKQMWTGHVLNGDDGGLTIIYRDGQDKTNRAASMGIEIGSYDQTDQETPISRFSLSNVMISHFHIAVQYNAQNVYYLAHHSLKVQDNDIGLQYGDDSHKGAFPNANSGENLSYYSCMFSSCDKVVESWTDDFPLNFYGTSFDYNNIVFQTNYGYKQFNVYGGHVEKANTILWGNALEGADAQSLSLNFFGTRFYVADKLTDVLFRSNIPETRIKFDSTMWQLAQVPEITKLCSDSILVDNRDTEWIGINIVPFSAKPGKNLTDYSNNSSLFTVDTNSSNGITTTLNVAKGLPDQKYSLGASFAGTTESGNSSVIETKERPVPRGRNLFYLVPYYLGGLGDKSYQAVKAVFKDSDGIVVPSYQSVGALLSRNIRAWNLFSGKIEVPDTAATYTLQIQVNNVPNGVTNYIGDPVVVVD